MSKLKKWYALVSSRGEIRVIPLGRYSSSVEADIASEDKKKLHSEIDEVIWIMDISELRHLGYSITDAIIDPDY